MAKKNQVLLNRYQQEKPEKTEIYARVPTALRQAIETVRLEQGLSVYKTIEISLMMFLENVAPNVAEDIRRKLYGK